MKTLLILTLALGAMTAQANELYECEKRNPETCVSPPPLFPKAPVKNNQPCNTRVDGCCHIGPRQQCLD